MPLAAEFAALLVSSERWAEASYPVIVYWVSSAPIGRTTIRNPRPWVLPPKKPVLFTVEVKTMEALAWWFGRKMRIRTTAAAPNTCHHTDTLLMMASRWLEKMFTSAASTMMMTKYMKTVSRLPATWLGQKKVNVRATERSDTDAPGT